MQRDDQKSKIDKQLVIYNLEAYANCLQNILANLFTSTFCQQISEVRRTSSLLVLHHCTMFHCSEFASKKGLILSTIRQP